MRRIALAGLLALLGVIGQAEHAGVVQAQNTDAERAEALFAQGKDRMAQDDLEHACPLLAQSFAADPASGTLLALAICDERAGKLASAYRAYVQVAERSKLDQRADREQAARERATALEPKLSKLKLRVSGDERELELRLDDQALAREALAVPIAVDGGQHRIEVFASGESRWSTQVMIASSGETKDVEVPQLQAPALVERAATPPAPREHVHRSAAGGLSGGQIAGIATAGAGVLSLAIAGGLAVVASNKNRDSKPSCDGDLCTAHGAQLRRSAWKAGNGASVALISGAALAVVGAAIFFASGAPEQPSDYAFLPWLDQQGAGAALQADF